MAVGAALRSAREDHGLSVDDVSRATNVRVTLVAAMEDGDFSGCGGDVYARGHLRSIARVVGVDAVALIAEFDSEHGGPPSLPLAAEPLLDPSGRRSVPAPRVPVGGETTELAGPVAARLPTRARTSRPAGLTSRAGERALRPRRRAGWLPSVVGAVLVLVIVVVGADLVRGTAGVTTALRPAVPPGGSSLTRASSPPPPRPGRTPPASPTAAGPACPTGVCVRVRVVGDSSWVLVKGAGATLLEQVLARGATMDFTDPAQLRLVLGNAGAVDLVVNGHDLGVQGKPGEVRPLTFTAATAGPPATPATSGTLGPPATPAG